MERIANFPALPVDGSPGGDSILLHDVRLLAREVLESRAEVQRLRLEAECLHASDADFARFTTALHQLRDERDAARLTSDASHEVLCRVLTLTRDAIAEVENTERGWHAHGTEFDPEWPAEYVESGNLQALRARLAALSLPTPAPEATE